MSGCVDCGENMDEQRVDMMPFCDLCYHTAAIFYGDPSIRLRQLKEATNG